MEKRIKELEEKLDRKRRRILDLKECLDRLDCSECPRCDDQLDLDGFLEECACGNFYPTMLTLCISCKGKLRTVVYRACRVCIPYEKRICKHCKITRRACVAAILSLRQTILTRDVISVIVKYILEDV